MSNRAIIIVPVDNSRETERTVQYAIGVARQGDADVHALQVVPRAGSLWRAPDDERALRARLRALRPAAEEDRVALRIVTRRGVPDRVIPAYAQISAASMVVLRGHYGSSRFWRTRSVASRLSRSSPVPVLVMPTHGDASAVPAIGQIVVAVDFTVASAVALRTAIDLSERHGARLALLHAMAVPDHMVLSGGEAARIVQRLPADSQALAARWTRTAVALGSRDPEAVVVTGDAARGIVDTAAVVAADLIVMGVAPRTRIGEALSGSTLRAVLRSARAPVLALPVVGGAHPWTAPTEDNPARLALTAYGMMGRAA